MKLKTEKINSLVKLIESDHSQLMKYLKSRYPLFHNSNFFSKDFQYGIKRFLESKNIEVDEVEVQHLAASISNSLEANGIFIRTNSSGWKINYPDFVTTTPGDPL